MSQRAVEEREQRRGLVLGLTLAEVLLLILFLLMLALGSRMEYWRTEAEQRQQRYNELVATHDSLRTIQAELVKNGAVDIKSVQELVTRLSRVQELERSLSELKQEYSRLSSQVVTLKSLGADVGKTLQAVSAALERAKQIDPNDPPALLKRALDILDRLGPATQPDQVKPLSQMMADLDLVIGSSGVHAAPSAAPPQPRQGPIVYLVTTPASRKPTPPRSRDGPLGAQDCSGIEMKGPRCRAQ
jgi:hypothetical protein